MTADHGNRRTGLTFVSLLGLLCLQAAGAHSAARAQPLGDDDHPQPPRDAAPASAGITDELLDREHWLRKLAAVMQGQETHDQTRQHAAVLEAFRPIVSHAARRTVCVYSGDQQVALGTIVDPSGYIISKGSELRGSITCVLPDGRRCAARLAGEDRSSDLALLKIDVDGLPSITWSSDALPAVGGWVVTPGAAELPLAVGIVSVAAHPVRGGVLGIQMAEDPLGARITFVVPGSGAALAGLAVGDIITHVNDQPLADSDQMVATTSNMLPGEQLALRILRDRQSQRISATLGSVADTLASRRAQFQDRLGAELSQRRYLFPSVIEHDSVLEPRQCGGVLLNLRGEAIGVNIARASRISSYAIPAEVAVPIVRSLQAADQHARATTVASQTPGGSLEQ